MPNAFEEFAPAKTNAFEEFRPNAFAEFASDNRPTISTPPDDRESVDQTVQGTSPQWDQLTRQIESRDSQPLQGVPETPWEAIKQGWQSGNEEAMRSPLGLPAKALAFVPKPSAQTVQNALDVINPSVPLETPDRPPTAAAKRIAGGVSVARQVPEMLASPLGVSTLGMGAAPGLAQKAVSAAFLADVAAHVPEAAKRAGTASVTGDEQEKVEAYGGLALPIVLAPSMALHVAKAREAGLNKSADAVEQLTKGEPNARSITSPAEVHGDLQPQPTAREGQMPVAEGGEGIQPRKVQEPAPVRETQEVTPKNWDRFNEDLSDNLDSFSPARNTGKRNYALSDLADRFTEFARQDKSGKSPLELVKDFADQDEAPASQIKKLRASLKDMQPNAEVAPLDKFISDVDSGAITKTEDARSFGDTVKTPEEIARLKQAYLDSTKKVKTLLESEPSPTKMDELAKVQNQPSIINEAIESATGAYDVKATDSAQYYKLMREGQPKSAPIPVNEGALGEMGMGAAKPGEPMGTPMFDLTEVVKALPDAGKPEVVKAFDLGESVSKAKDTLESTVNGLKAAGSYLKKRLIGKPEVTNWRRMLGNRHLALSESTINARRFLKATLAKIPSKESREAISNWVDTGGDIAKLKQAAAETKPIYRKGYERAQNLTPDELHAAKNIQNYFDTRLDQAIDAGILEGGIENYLHRTYEADSPWKKGVLAELRSGIFTGKPALAKKRVFEYDFEAEKAGKHPVKDFAKRVAAYDLALNKAIADRNAIKQMMEMKMPDGRPMIDVGGGGKVIENPAGETEATLINRSRKVNSEDPVENRGDYKSYDHPALRKWKWVASDSEGKPIFLQGDVLVHPDAMKQVGILFDRSKIRQNPIGRAALGVSSTIKQTMLDLSLFHQTQIAVHAAEHRTWGPIKEIDFKDPDVRGLIRGGAVVGETSGRELFSEGLSGSSLTKHIPWVGERIQRYQDYLFGDFIPRIKVAMGKHALERNRAKYPDLSKEQLYQMTADQMNAAFGELNYEMIGRSKTTQDVLRLALLAPDFLEARTRFVGQAGTKYGAEQRNALILGAVTMYFFARIANKMLDDEYHFEPKNAFNIVHNGKSYGLRTVQGDLMHLVTEPGQFVNHRLNPIYAKPALEFATGRDYFGRKRTATEKLKDIALTPVPISLRGIYSGQEQTLMESALNSMGVVTKRDSPSSDMAKLADEWKTKHKIAPEPGEFIYDAEKDPYRKIRLAAERDDIASVRSEIGAAKAAGLTDKKITEHFKLSAAHKFTGSKKNESQFINSLTKDQQKIYQDALRERQRIRENVLKAF